VARGIAMDSLPQPPRGFFTLQELGEWVEKSFPQCAGCLCDLDVLKNAVACNPGTGGGDDDDSENDAGAGANLAESNDFKFLSWESKPATMQRDFDLFFPALVMVQEMQRRRVTRLVEGPLVLDILDAGDTVLARLRVSFVEIRKVNKQPLGFLPCRFSFKLSGARYVSVDSDNEY
jgi:hypothetical protein